jgi:hypothetical protein
MHQFGSRGFIETPDLNRPILRHTEEDYMTYVCGENYEARTILDSLGRDIARAVSRWPLIAEARVRTQASLCEICCGQWDRFFSLYLRFPVSVLFHQYYALNFSFRATLHAKTNGRSLGTLQPQWCSHRNRGKLRKKSPSIISSLHLLNWMEIHQVVKRFSLLRCSWLKPRLSSSEPRYSARQVMWCLS